MSAGKSGKQLSHLDQRGNARMVDIGAKNDSRRVAVAGGRVRMSAAAFELFRSGEIGKGDVLGVARVAGIMAAKKTPELIPLAHPLLLTRAEIEFELDVDSRCIMIKATVETTGRTGVEMEALTAASISALAIYDMCKSVDKGIVIENLRLLRKSGGKSGDYLIK
jgi:cyclic pyranopterin phosphate synthase